MIGLPNKTDLGMEGGVHQSAMTEVQFSEEKRG